MFSFIYAGINGWVNNREASDLTRHRAHYDVIVMLWIHNRHLVPRLAASCGFLISFRRKTLRDVTQLDCSISGTVFYLWWIKISSSLICGDIMLHRWKTDPASSLATATFIIAFQQFTIETSTVFYRSEHVRWFPREHVLTLMCGAVWYRVSFCCVYL